MTAKWKVVAIQTAERVVPFRLAKTLVRLVLAANGIGFAGKVRESGEAGFLRRLATSRVLSSKPTIVDVGAHTGEYIEIAKETWPDARIFGFEPSASHYERLSAFLRERKYVGVKTYPIGLSSEAGTRTLSKHENISGMASLEARDLQHLGIEMTIREEVTLAQLDDVMAREGIDTIDLLKIDIEGHELSCLKGATGLINGRKIKIVQYEYGHAHVASKNSVQDFFNFFRPNGYVMGVIKPTGRLAFFERYDEFLELFLASNYVAVLPEIAVKFGYKNAAA